MKAGVVVVGFAHGHHAATVLKDDTLIAESGQACKFENKAINGSSINISHCDEQVSFQGMCSSANFG